MPKQKKSEVSEQQESQENFLEEAENTGKNEEKQTKTMKFSQSEFESKVIDLAKKGFTSEKIGERLKKEGIHSKEYSKKISDILKEKTLYINPDLKNIESKLEKIKKHHDSNKQDKKAMREKERVFAQLGKLKKYSKVQKI